MILEVWLTMLAVAALLCGVVLASYIVFALGTVVAALAWQVMNRGVL